MPIPSNPTVRIRRTLRRFARRVRRAARLPPRELLTTLHVVIVLVVVELLIRWVPLPRLTRLLGLRVNLDPARPDATQMLDSELPPSSQRQLRCTRRVADAWPSANGPCLRRSLVAGHLLRRHEPSVRLGIATDGDAVRAHAWVEIDHRPLESVTDYHTLQSPPRPVITSVP